VFAALAFWLVLACGLIVQTPEAPTKRKMAGDSEANPATSCGVENFRWNVKIFEDDDHAQVEMTVVQTTIEDLNAFPKPAEPYPPSKRIKPWELQVYRVRARLKAILPARDGDVHLFLEDPDKPEEHIIAEIPAPECVHDARQAEQYRAARAALSALKLNSVVEVTGVGFFDEANGLPFLKAKNGIELHPVFKISAAGKE
jgi:hypothetical protein